MAGAELWIVAGPNGAGKTTLTQAQPISALLRHVKALNPDDRTLELLRIRGYMDFGSTPQDVLQGLFLEAATQVALELDERLARSEAVCVETVLSTDKYRSAVEAVRNGGGFFGLIYVALRSPELAKDRVTIRVAAGGHDVPADRVAARWRRSINNLTWFVQHAHYVAIYDNSEDGAPVLIADNSSGTLAIHLPEAIPEITKALLPLNPKLP